MDVAVAALDPLAGVALDYGDPQAEYEAVRNSAGVVDRDDLAVIVVSGRDPVRMIHGLITNDLAQASADRAVYAGMLTAKGRTIAEIRAYKVAKESTTEVWMDLPREVLQPTGDHFRRFLPPLYARWRDASESLALLGVYGPRSRELLGAVFTGLPDRLAEDEVAVVELEGSPIRLVGTRYAGGEVGFDLLLERRLRDSLRDRLLHAGDGWARRVGFGALEVLRIEAGRPRGGRELTEEVIPTEAFEAIAAMERAISFTKGCYTGQEVIVRIAHRGHVNRHLRGLVSLSGTQLSPGDRLFHPETGKDIGWITSAAESPRVGAPVALGFVRRELTPGERVRVGASDGGEARVTELPFTAE